MNQANTIYFNSLVSENLNVPFSNKGQNVIIPAAEILNCPSASWDQPTINALKKFKAQEIALKGEGVGTWRIL